MNRSLRTRMLANHFLLVCACLSSTGCGDSPQGTTPPPEDQASKLSANRDTTSPSTPLPKSTDTKPSPLEVTGPELLGMRLDNQQTEAGWVRLFDGYTLYGWEIAGDANWRVDDQALRVDQGTASLLCTSLPWSNYELQLEFLADEATNSGIFLRTPLVPEDPATDCYELNIAPTDNPYPTGSLVKRHLVPDESLSQFDATTWHTYFVRCEGGTITVTLDGRELYTFTDETPIRTGRIGLQFNQGAIQFRNILARPIGLAPLLPNTATDDGSLPNWKQYPEMPGTFTLNADGHLEVRGGRTQLESTESYGNFALLATAQTLGPKQNSGIFFRCIPGEEMNGYECQINNDRVDNNPLLPADCGTGGIFRRLNARIVAADPDAWFSLLLLVHDDKMAAWVNGIQVSEWKDDRPEDPNPRRGKRLDPGTLMIQGHDPGTAVNFRQIDVGSL